MDRDSLAGELRAFLEDFLKSRDLELVDFIHRYEGRDLFLRILVDKPEGGISLDECARLNAELGDILDEKNILQQRYILEVSSPGLDRPLKTERDFARSLGRKVKVFLSEPVNNKLEWDGIIRRADAGIIYFETSGGTIELPLDKINKAKILL